MTKDTWMTVLRSWVLASALSLGSVLCLTGGFGLTIQAPGQIGGVCVLSALGCSLVLQHRRGSGLLLCIGAALGGYLWRLQQLDRQLLVLAQQLCDVYQRTCGWKFPRLSAASGEIDGALCCLGCAVSFTVSRAVSKGSGLLLPAGISLLPLVLCLLSPAAVPPPAALLAVLGGTGVLLLSGQVRHQSPRQGNQLAAAAAIAVTAALGALLWLCPKESYVNRSDELRTRLFSLSRSLSASVNGDMAALTSRLGSAASRQVALSDLGQRTPGEAEVMTVTTERGGTLYLRQRDYDSYDGRSWTASSLRREEFSCRETARETVTISTKEPQPWLYLPYYPAEGVTLLGGMAENPSGLCRYQVERSLLQQPRVTWKAPIPEGLSHYLALPENTRLGAGEVLAQLPEAESASLRAQQIAGLLRTGSYDLNPEKMREEEEDFALWFLESGKRGYCVHFATTAVVLLRAAGIPARYVTGYMVQTEADRTVTVTEGNAHAWAEYYEPGLGCWLVLEATPPAAQPSVESAAAQARTGTEPGEVPDSQGAASGSVPAAALCLLPVIPLQRWLRLAWKCLRRRRGSRNRQALQRWQEVRLLSRLLGQRPEKKLLMLAQKAKFSPHSLSEQELEAFDRYLYACRGQLKKKSFCRRLVHRYLYAVY